MNQDTHILDELKIEKEFIIKCWTTEDNEFASSTKIDTQIIQINDKWLKDCLQQQDTKDEP
jgi:hypothetical protein